MLVTFFFVTQCLTNAMERRIDFGSGCERDSLSLRGRHGDGSLACLHAS